MRLIKNAIFVDLNEREKIIINSLNGTMDRISTDTFEILSEWKNFDNIIPSNLIEKELYNLLVNKGYLVEDYEEECKKKNSIIKNLSTKHLENKEKCKHITFLLTYDCNFRCPYCFEGNCIEKKKVMSYEYIDAALKLAGENLESIGLFGGEPLLLKNRKAIEYLISKTEDKIYNITTNGYYLLEYFSLLKKLKISSIMVTLDGKEKTHDKRRFLANGKPTFYKILIGIEKFLANGIPICIRMNLDENNFEEGRELKLELIDKFNEYREFLSFEISPMMHISTEKRTKIFSDLYELDRGYTNDDRLKMNRFSGRFAPIINSITVGGKNQPVYSFCDAHKNLLIVDPYGDIFTCLPAVGIKSLSVGRFYPNIEFKENSIYYRNIEKISKCKACEYSLLCGGGCPLALSSYDDFFQPECFSIHSQIHELLPNFYKIEFQDKGRGESNE